MVAGLVADGKKVSKFDQHGHSFFRLSCELDSDKGVETVNLGTHFRE